jgi:hypothetical protein
MTVFTKKTFDIKGKRKEAGSMIKTYKLKDVDFGNGWTDYVENRWEYKQFIDNKDWREGWISFDCCYYHKDSKSLFLGVTSFDGDIFYEFDVETKEFVNMGFKKIGNPYDAKFHRSLCYHPQTETLYAAVALLHCTDRYKEAPGGAVVAASVDGKRLEKLSVPIPHVYIQACDIDIANNKLYLQFFTPEYIGEFDLCTREFRLLGLAGSGIGGMAQGQNILVDKEGNLWGAWCLTRAWQDKPGKDVNRIFIKKAHEPEITWLNIGLPYSDGEYGYNKADAFFELGDDHHIYVSDVKGSLYRISKETYQVDFLFNPVPYGKGRFSAMIKAANGDVYAAVGKDEDCQIIKVNLCEGTYEKVCSLQDQNGIVCRQIHHMTEGPHGILYCCENDNPKRSSYLWEIDLR